MKYSTNFATDENPLSESGAWRQGAVTGLDWTNVRALSGGAFGTEDASAADFKDSIACLQGLGTWGWHQRCRGKLHITNSTTEPPTIEGELLLHFSIAANSATGYELTISNVSGNKYIQVNRWNGALGNFTLLQAGVQGNAGFGAVAAEGDIWEFRDEGTSSVPLLKVYQNGVLLTGLTYDTTPDGTKYTGGAPGIGFYDFSNLSVPNSLQDYIQWDQFDATDDYFDGEPVQAANSAPGTSATSTAKAFTNNVVKGNLLVAACYHGPGTHAATFSDTRSNTWSVIGGVNQATDGHRIDIAVAIAKDAGACTVTADHSGDAATQFRGLIVAEMRSGFASDKAASNTGGTGSGTSSAGPSGTTSAAFELLLNTIGSDNSSAATPTSTSNYVTTQDIVGGPSTRWMLSLLARLTFATGTFTATATLPNSEPWSALINTLSLVSTQALVNYRFRNDDGDEATATWMQPEQTGVSVVLGQVFRLRFQIDTTGDEPSQPLTLQYRKVGTTTWFTINTVSLVQLVPSANIAAGAATATTTQITAPAGKTGSDFTAGKISDDTNPITGVDIGFSGFSEFEFALRLGSVPTAGEQYEFQLSGTSMTNTVTPRITMLATPAGQVPLQMRMG